MSGRGGFGGGRGGFGRGGGAPRGGRGGFGGGRGGFGRAPLGPPESVVEIGVFSHVCKNDIVCKATNLQQVPKVTKRAFFENSEQMGIVDEVLGPVEGYLFSVRLNEGVVASSFKEGAKVFMDPRDLLHMDIFTKPRSRNAAARGPRGVGGARGGFGGGRGGGRGGFGGGRGGGRGGFGGGRGGFGGGRGGAPRGGGFGGGRGGFGGGRGRGGF